MRNLNLKPIDWENSKLDLGINIIINEMLSNKRKIIHNHIRKFLTDGGDLKALTLSEHADGTIILRSDDRTIVTVSMIIRRT
jgi:hypothetical protein